MSDPDQRPDSAAGGDGPEGPGRRDRARQRLEAAKAGAKSASERHVAVAVPLRAVERNRRIAASVLAGGLAYRLFLWMLPFGLLFGGALGLMNADSTEDAVGSGGLPGAVVDAVGDISRSTGSESWWLLGAGVAFLLWAGMSGAKAVALVHSLVWDEPPARPKPLLASLAFTGVCCGAIVASSPVWWLRDDGLLVALLAIVLSVVPMAALWLWASLHLPHGDAPWRALVPGALLVAIGLLVLHEVVVYFLVPQLEKSTALYGGLGATTTLIFFMYLAGILVVSAPVLNHSLHEELRRVREKGPDDGTASPAGASPG